MLQLQCVDNDKNDNEKYCILTKQQIKLQNIRNIKKTERRGL